MYVVEFSRRADDGPMLIGPFGSPAGARRWIGIHGPYDAEWHVRHMSVPDHL